MELINHNPFRVAGVLSSATEKELQKRKTKVKAFSKVGKEVNSEYDFQFLESIPRTEDSIAKAFSNIEQNQDKVNFSLFWFLNASPFDNTAFEYLKNGDEEKAVEIWEKVTLNKKVNSKNFSAFNNLGTYKLLSKTQDGQKEGVEAKIRLIESDFFENFVHSVADETFTINNEKQIEQWIDQLLTQLKKGYPPSKALRLFANCNGSTQKYLTRKFTEEPIHKIESQIEKAKKKRTENSSRAHEFGLILYTNCKSDLSLLKSLLGSNDLKYKMIADSLAKEIMQCGIDYFNDWKDAEDPSKESLKLLKSAKSMATGSQARDRVNENIKGIEEWAETLPIKDDLNFITNRLSKADRSSGTIEDAQELIWMCQDKLENIKSNLGPNDELYLNVSSTVVNMALGMVIEAVNDAQSGIQFDQSKLVRLPSIISEAVSTINSMGSLDMNRQTQMRYEENRTTINSINNQLNRVKRQVRSSSGCYIATMAYGDYDHSQVLELRNFRDHYLSKSQLGRGFIKIYYKHSPKLVEKLKNRQTINYAIRKVLDQFIKAIKK